VRCAPCHLEIAAEWKGSNHARAAVDPLYVEDLKHQGEPYFCDHCHAPLLEQQKLSVSGLWLAWPKLVPRAGPNPLFDAALHDEGVTCVACHQREGAMVGPRADVKSPHPTRGTDELAKPQLCEGCHTLALTELGSLKRPLMETVTEWNEYRKAGGDKVCVDCHLPMNGPRRSHRLRGPFDGDFVRTGVVVSGDSVGVTGGEVVAAVKVGNESGHRVPTAEPHRRVEVLLEVLDAEGKVVASKAARIERDVDLDALVERSDTTLAPREQREVVVKAAAKGVRARLSVRFHTWSDDKQPVHELFAKEYPL
jgi:hypothetical protein